MCDYNLKLGFRTVHRPVVASLHTVEIFAALLSGGDLLLASIPE